jgi:hypothetical protein
MMAIPVAIAPTTTKIIRPTLDFVVSEVLVSSLVVEAMLVGIEIEEVDSVEKATDAEMCGLKDVIKSLGLDITVGFNVADESGGSNISCVSIIFSSYYEPMTDVKR